MNRDHFEECVRIAQGFGEANSITPCFDTFKWTETEDERSPFIVATITSGFRYAYDPRDARAKELAKLNVKDGLWKHMHEEFGPRVGFSEVAAIARKVMDHDGNPYLLAEELSKIGVIIDRFN